MVFLQWIIFRTNHSLYRNFQRINVRRHFCFIRRSGIIKHSLSLLRCIVESSTDTLQIIVLVNSWPFFGIKFACFSLYNTPPEEILWLFWLDYILSIKGVAIVYFMILLIKFLVSHENIMSAPSKVLWLVLNNPTHAHFNFHLAKVKIHMRRRISKKFQTSPKQVRALFGTNLVLILNRIAVWSIYAYQ